VTYALPIKFNGIKIEEVIVDLYCKRCGEPCELDHVQLELTPQERNDFHDGICCPSCKGKKIERTPFRAVIAAELHALLGDDLDGLACEMEDAEMMLGGEFWE